MAAVDILGYHTCSTYGGWSYVKCESPFLSGSGENQWLTQGYYFWTDSDFFAHKWGKLSYSNNYAIVKCDIEIEKDLLLDLVGCVKSQRYFKKYLERFRAKLKTIDPTQEPTVHAFIAFMRNLSKNNTGFFPFIAIKAEDSGNKYNTDTLSFIGGPEEMIISIQRQQLCLFESGLQLITRKEVTFPEKFTEGAHHE